MMPLGQGLPSPATMLFNCLIRGIMPVINKLPVGSNNDEEHYKVITDRQTRNDTGNDTSKSFVSLPIVVQQKDGGPWNNQGKR